MMSRRDFASGEGGSSGGSGASSAGTPLLMHGAALTVILTSAVAFGYFMREDSLRGRSGHGSGDHGKGPHGGEAGGAAGAAAAPEERRLGGLPRVYLDATVGDGPKRRMVLELRSVRGGYRVGGWGREQPGGGKGVGMF